MKRYGLVLSIAALLVSPAPALAKGEGSPGASSLTAVAALESFCLARSQDARVVANQAVARGMGEPQPIQIDPETQAASGPVLGLVAPSVGADGFTIAILDSQAGATPETRDVVVMQCSVSAPSVREPDFIARLTELYGPAQRDSNGMPVWLVRLPAAGGAAVSLPWADSLVWTNGAHTLKTQARGDRLMAVVINTDSESTGVSVLVYAVGIVIGRDANRV